VCCEPVFDQHAHLRLSSRASTYKVELEPVPLSAGVARSFIRTAFASVDERSGDLALLLTSELVTNAILHARTRVQLGVLLDDDMALVCVADRLAEPRALTPLAQSEERFGGRGLALVADLAEEWGTTAYTGGKTVWFLLRTASDGERRVG
jgi:anti-sigma regulatory factor (Ser/Thr protein kinase)